MRLAHAAVAAAVLFAVGCGGGSPTGPNPDLKVPEVPPGRGAEKGGEAPKAVKPAKRQ
jgi:hypothetical protein